jgi:anthranilate phosphoribosyltransferase
MKKILEQLFGYKALDREQAKQVMLDLAGGSYNDTEIVAFITVYLMRSISIPELLGFRDGLLELALPVETGIEETIDIVGTGGDGKNTFNISTLACFIVAGAGKKVVKHGNYGATSVSGASNLMESLGYRFTTDTDRIRKELEQSNFSFLHAPLFHPALKAVGQIRKNLGFRSLFNMMGPLVNPAQPSHQLVGVYNLEMARNYTYILQQSGKKFAIIHSLDGYDEISLTNDTKVITHTGEKMYTAEELGKRTVSPTDIQAGNSVKEAVAIFLKILNGKGSWPQNAVVLANAAMALYTTGAYNSYNDAYNTAVESLESGNAYACFKKLLTLQS